MKLFILSILGVLFVSGPIAAVPASLSEVQINRLDGAPLALSELNGKAILFVNVASRCGFTKQYEELQALHRTYTDKGLVVIGVPSNDFNQETGDAEEIQAFCERNYGVDFVMTEKIQVRNQPLHPLYAYLTESNPKVKAKVSWNFNKILVDRSGQVAGHYGSWVKPQSKKLVRAIEAAL